MGTVKAGDKEFVTQGKDADDFIEMVNESVIVSFDVPREYVEILSKSYLFYPPPAELNKLKNSAVTASSFGTINALKSPGLQTA